MAERARRALQIQASYYIASGLLPLCSRRAFEYLTGPKRDWWLVQMVALLAVCAGVSIGIGSREAKTTPQTIALSASCALSFAAIDTIYALNGTISPIYLADAAVELALLAAVLVPTRP